MEIVLTFQTTNQAIKAEQLLLGAAFDVKVMPLPPAIRAGCGLCLRLPEGQAAKGLRVLRESGVEPEGAYTRAMAGGKSNYLPYGI